MSRNCRKAFTLIELLVVVAIIVVLIAILLPSLGRAREQAKQVSCQAHFSQIGKSLVMYASNNSDRLPYSQSSGVDATSWMVLLLHDMQGGAVGGTTFATGNTKQKAQQVFQCPSAKVISLIDASYSSHPRLLPNISANDPVTGKAFQTIKYFKVNNPGQTAIAFDARLWISATSATTRSVASDIDAYRLTYDTFLLANDSRATASSTSSESGITYDPPAGDNADVASTASASVTFRFRHLNDTAVNVLMVDGHVESFTTGPSRSSTNLKRKYINISMQ